MEPYRDEIRLGLGDVKVIGYLSLRQGEEEQEESLDFPIEGEPGESERWRMGHVRVYGMD